MKIHFKLLQVHEKALPLHRVFHGIRFKVNEKIGCRDDNLLFLYRFLP